MHEKQAISKIKLQNKLKISTEAERKFNKTEIARLRSEQTKLKEKMDKLFDLRLDGELDRENFDLKRNDLLVKINRLKQRIEAHENASTYFDDTILGLFDIATQVGYIFVKSNNITLKRLLLKFVLKKLILTERELSYKLRFPFSEFEKSNKKILKSGKSSRTPETLENKGFKANNDKIEENITYNEVELQKKYKKERVTEFSATLTQIGDA